MTANEITASLLRQITLQFPDTVWVYRNNRVDAMAIGRGGKQRRISAGINGQGDLSGILTVRIGDTKVGLRLEIEVKAGADKISPIQHAFRIKVQSMGGVYLVCRDVAETMAEIRRLVS